MFSRKHIMMSSISSKILLQFDGGCNNNPGSGGSGCVIYKDKQKIAELAQYFERTTNNEAEYSGLLLGLNYLVDNNNYWKSNLQIQGDSLLVISQISNKWKVKAENLKPFHKQAKDLLLYFNVTGIQHIKREYNTAADQLSNEVRVLKDNICREFIEHS